MRSPTFNDVLLARRVINKYLLPTPLMSYPALDELVGTSVLIKHENYQPTGAFKVRGGINLLSQLSPREKERGVIAASTGNHGQSVAYAAKLFGVRSVIVVPEKANALKVDSMKRSGAEVLMHGKDFDEARTYCEQVATTENLRYIHSGNEPLLIAGVGTLTLEILETSPDTNVIIVPVGGGSGVAAASLVAKTINPRVRVIGVQAEAAPAAFNSWREKKLLEDRMETAAEGLATRVAFELPQRMMWELLDDFVLVSEDEMRDAVALYIEKAHTLVEHAGAASLAVALKLCDQLSGQKVALVLSGGNISIDQLRSILLECPANQVRK
jgi:threonine dehydratase